jgi:hypothetical protein
MTCLNVNAANNANAGRYEDDGATFENLVIRVGEEKAWETMQNSPARRELQFSADIAPIEPHTHTS